MLACKTLLQFLCSKYHIWIFITCIDSSCGWCSEIFAARLSSLLNIWTILLKRKQPAFIKQPRFGPCCKAIIVKITGVQALLCILCLKEILCHYAKDHGPPKKHGTISLIRVLWSVIIIVEILVLKDSSFLWDV